MYVATAIFFEPVGRHLDRESLLLPADASCQAAVHRLAQTGAPCAMVVDGERRPLGIVTAGDVARRVTFQARPDDPVRRAMTAPVVSVRDDEPVYRALARMRRHGWRHLPVVAGDGRFLGTFSVAAAFEAPLELIGRLVGDDSVAGLARVKAGQAELARTLLAGAQAVTEIQALFSDINLDLHREVVELMLESMAEHGWGRPPVAFSVIVMGSIGRSESLLAPDQDNGFILDDHPEGERAIVEPFFAELAARVNAALAQVGFPLCRGNVMAQNPTWRKTRAAWRRQVEGWLGQRSPQAILDADICFDFRAATAPAGFAEELREHTLRLVAQSRPFLRDMCTALMDHRVALGLFGGLDTEPAADGHRANLKLRGMLPLVGAVRLYALRERVAETSTVARLDALHARGVLSDDERDALADAYRTLTGAILEQQIADLAAGRAAGNLVSTADWSRPRQRRLTEGLQAIEQLQRRLREDFTGRIL
jgi:signal-transduction protein with cAMP-binding, CBS, and nucleotidyltransferase domain